MCSTCTVQRRQWLDKKGCKICRSFIIWPRTCAVQYMHSTERITGGGDWAQPPLELIRQWLDGKGCFDRADCSWKNIVDVVFMAAMGLPGGSRSALPPRLQRHFHLITLPDFSPATYTRIYSVRARARTA